MTKQKRPEPVEKPEPIDNTELVEDFRKQGGHILHVHTRNNHNGRRAMTLAFIPKSGRVEVATSVTHRNDTFTKKMGTKAAIEHFKEGKTVNIPLRRSASPTRQLADMFGHVTW